MLIMRTRNLITPWVWCVGIMGITAREQSPSFCLSSFCLLFLAALFLLPSSSTLLALKVMGLLMKPIPRLQCALLSLMGPYAVIGVALDQIFVL
nr:hypothetical protein Iba_chr05eCG12810 [Ipomoea batatas]GMD39422.1 hypothetical protein Iba_scaffold45030CG0010 [Ipomoea batatas]